MKSLKKFIKKVYSEETTKNKAFCKKEKSIYTVKKIETEYFDFMLVCECIRSEEFLKYAVAYNDYYFAVAYAEELITDNKIIDIKSIFESLDFHELTYEKFLIQLQEEAKLALSLLDSSITEDNNFI